MEAAAARRLLKEVGLEPDRLRSDPAFQVWRDQLPRLLVDGQTLYLRGGDMGVDEDQLLIEWAQFAGLASEAALRAAAVAQGRRDQGGGDFLDIEGEGK